MSGNRFQAIQDSMLQQMSEEQSMLNLTETGYLRLLGSKYREFRVEQVKQMLIADIKQK